MNRVKIVVHHLPTNSIIESERISCDDDEFLKLQNMVEKASSSKLSYLKFKNNNGDDTYIPSKLLEESLITIVKV